MSSEPVLNTSESAMVSKETEFDDRLLAEAIRLHEDSGSLSMDVSTADTLGLRAGGDFEHRIIARAVSIDKAAGVGASLVNVRGAFRFALVGILVASAAAGAGAVQAAMGTERDNIVNVYVLLFVILGVETLALLAWSLFTLMGSGRVNGVPGRLVAEISRRFVLLTHRNPTHVSALRAVGSIVADRSIGRWGLASVTHAAWSLFLVVAVVMMLFLLSTRSYVFVWETTILSPETYVAVTRYLAIGPEILGLGAPGEDEVRGSQWLGQGTAADVARDAWARLLLGSVVIYGLLPRLALLVMSVLLYRRGCRQFRLDTARPGYARLVPRLMPRAAGLGFVDSSEGIEPHRSSTRGSSAIRRIKCNPAGPTAMMGLETSLDSQMWPPRMEGMQILDLGQSGGGGAFRGSLETLRRADPAPRLLILACSLVSPPDRGMFAFLETITATVDIPLGLVLIDGQKLRNRTAGDDAQMRITDWRTLAQRAGIAKERIIEVDLDNATDASLSKLAAFAGASVAGTTGADRLARAFALIRSEAVRWSQPPGVETQAELHRSIARLYRESDSGWVDMFDARTVTAENLATRLQSGSELFVGMLPGRLVADPSWLAAGAMAGALSCVAAATLVVPGAIAALPLWAGLGAAFSAATSAALARHKESEPDVHEIGDAVRAATLFSLVLDAQGNDEMAITRIIDDAIADEDTSLKTEEQIGEWLDRVHLRYRQAERREAAR